MLEVNVPESKIEETQTASGENNFIIAKSRTKEGQKWGRK